jgi:hypothetical protein
LPQGIARKTQKKKKELFASQCEMAWFCDQTQPLSALTAIMADIKREQPEAYAPLKSWGMLLTLPETIKSISASH